MLTFEGERAIKIMHFDVCIRVQKLSHYWPVEDPYFSYMVHLFFVNEYRRLSRQVEAVAQELGADSVTMNPLYSMESPVKVFDSVFFCN